MTNVCSRFKIGTYKDLLTAQKWKMTRINGFGKELVSELDDLREAVFPQVCKDAERYSSSGKNSSVKREAYIDGVMTERLRLMNSLSEMGISLSEKQIKALWNIK